MRGRGAHMWMCGVMVVAALILVLTTGSAFAFLPVLGCVLMMGVMMWMIGGSGRSGRGGHEPD